MKRHLTFYINNFKALDSKSTICKKIILNSYTYFKDDPHYPIDDNRDGGIEDYYLFLFFLKKNKKVIYGKKT